MALTNKEKRNLNRSMRSAQDVKLGDLVAKIADPFLMGSVKVSTAQSNASQVVIDTEKEGITGYMVFHYSSDAVNPLIAVENTGSKLIVTSESAASPLAHEDIISWIAF